MGIKFYSVLFCFFLIVTSGIGQTNQDKIIDLETRIDENRQQYDNLIDKIGVLKLDFSKENYLDKVGLPSTNYIEHKAMFLEYAEAHQQPKWVAHCILPEIVDIGKGRTNDFREDPLVKTGTAVELDYFIKKMNADSTYDYDGFGYDRGHLAASADFRWSSEAVSESYYYSNISPMLDVFNREIWADLEDLLRQYVLTHKVPLYIVTAPILTDDLKKIDRSINGVSIPEKFIKVAVDLVNHRSIGFIIRNEKAEAPIDAFATTVDYVEEITGYNFFPKINEDIESSISKEAWFADDSSAYVEPISSSKLRDGYFNTVFGGRKKGLRKKIKVCGTVVASRYSRKGHGWLNLDRAYPNDYFSIMIKKESLKNFDYDPVAVLIDQKQCFEGEVLEIAKKPIIIVSKQNKVSDYRE